MCTHTNEKYFFSLDGKEYVDEELALVRLLSDGILFSNSRDYSLTLDGNLVNAGHTIVLFVSCNDIFYWGTADGENISHDEIGSLLKMHLDDPEWGSIKWCCKKRNLQPQVPVKLDMITAGAWEEWMNQLPER